MRARDDRGHTKCVLAMTGAHEVRAFDDGVQAKDEIAAAVISFAVTVACRERKKKCGNRADHRHCEPRRGEAISYLICIENNKQPISWRSQHG